MRHLIAGSLAVGPDGQRRPWTHLGRNERPEGPRDSQPHPRVMPAPQPPSGRFRTASSSNSGPGEDASPFQESRILRREGGALRR